MEGSDITIDCDNLPREEPYRVQWLFNETTNLPPNHSVRNLCDDLFVLSLGKVTTDYTGKYTCINLNDGLLDHAILIVVGEFILMSFTF